MIERVKQLRGFFHEPSRQWFKDLSAYYHGLTWDEYWVRYTLARDCFNDCLNEGDPQGAYETEWCFFRQPYYHRNRTWYDILRVMHKYEFADVPTILDYGCGAGDMARWLAWRKPHWDWTLVDLKTPHRDYAEWRMAQLHLVACSVQDPLEYVGKHCVIVCRETLEHLEQPLSVVQRLLDALVPGGTLFWDFEDAPHGANVYPPEQRTAILTLLSATQEGREEVYRKPRDLGGIASSTLPAQQTGQPTTSATPFPGSNLPGG